MMLTKNSCHRVRITELSPRGVGIGTLEGLPIFVDRALPGERVDIKLIKVTSRYSVGRLVDIRNPSDERVEPFCPVFHRCGGCSLQHLSYKGQLAWKTEQVREQLVNVRRVDNVRISQAIGMAEPLHYRNKAQYPFTRKKGRILAGFYAKRSHEIIEHVACAIQFDQINAITTVIREFLMAHNVSIYDEARHQGLLRHIMIRVGRRSGEIMVVLVLNGRGFPQQNDLIASLRKTFPDITGIVLNINQAQTNVISGKEYFTIYGKSTLRDQLGEYQFDISPNSFYQVNPVQTERLYRKVIELAELRRDDVVADLYCGIGTLSLWLAHHAQIVYGVERNENAVRDARKNAVLNGFTNLEFMEGAAEVALSALVSQGIRLDVIVVDPPRKGCEDTLLKTIAAVQPKRIMYVSCNPATLARDLSFLAQHGFQVVEIQPIDMFPHTTHIECVAKIESQRTLPA